MVDIHSHILHEVDDGSNSLENSLKMLKESSRQGIDRIILTPHLRGGFNCDRETIEVAFNELKAATENAGINVELFLGREIRIDKYFKNTLENAERMANSNYILAEFDFFENTDIADCVYEIKRLGSKVIVAHFERYSYASLDDAYAIKDEGGLIQINADSLFGRSGVKARKIANALIEEGLCDFVASDYHYNRVNLMGKAYKKVARKYGQETADKLFILNADKILKL